MQKEYRLKKRGTFQYIYRRGSSTACRELVLLYTKSRSTRVGFSVSKKIGNAVTRNYQKRRMRECMRTLLHSIKPGNYIFIARNSINELSYINLYTKIESLLQKQGLLND